MKLWKSTITIYSPYNPDTLELSAIARDAETGESYCSEQHNDVVEPDELPEGAREFFRIEEDA